MPAAFLHRGVAVAGRRFEEEVVSPIQPLREMAGDVLGVSGQTGPLEKGLPKGFPALLREEVVLEPAEKSVNFSHLFCEIFTFKSI